MSIIKDILDYNGEFVENKTMKHLYQVNSQIKKKAIPFRQINVDG